MQLKPRNSEQRKPVLCLPDLLPASQACRRGSAGPMHDIRRLGWQASVVEQQPEPKRRVLQRESVAL